MKTSENQNITAHYFKQPLSLMKPRRSSDTMNSHDLFIRMPDCNFSNEFQLKNV